jgi:hypothetical protein
MKLTRIRRDIDPQSAHFSGAGSWKFECSWDELWKKVSPGYRSYGRLGQREIDGMQKVDAVKRPRGLFELGISADGNSNERREVMDTFERSEGGPEVRKLVGFCLQLLTGTEL